MVDSKTQKIPIGLHKMATEVDPSKKQGAWKCFRCEKWLHHNKRIHEESCSKRTTECTCRVCKTVFPDRWALNSHFKQTHTDHAIHECLTCGYLAEGSSYLQMHQTTHTEERAYECKVCKKTFKSGATLNTQMQIHKETFKCVQCGVALSSMSNLQTHLAFHEKREKIKCLNCECVFEDKFTLDEHVKKEHPGYEPIECKLCGMRFTKYCNFVSHTIRQHSESKQYKCDLCGQEFHFEANYEDHLNKHETHKTDKEYHCFYCENPFTDLFSLRRHMDNFHEDYIVTKEDNRRFYKCPKCDWVGRVTVLCEHFATHRENHLQCKYCSYQFDHITAKAKHEVKHIDQQGNVHFNCYKCSAKFQDGAKYAEHFDTHYEKTVKPYKCKYCSLVFKRPSECAKHTVKVHKENLIKNANDKLTDLERELIDIFGYFSELIRDPERNDKGELAFNCQKCGKKFYGCMVLKMHYRTSATCKEVDKGETSIKKKNNRGQTYFKQDTKTLIEESDTLSTRDISASECKHELTPLPLTVAVYQYAGRDAESCLIIWCSNLESDLTSLLSIHPHRVFICVSGNKLVIQGRKFTPVTLIDHGNKFPITIVHGYEELNTCKLKTIEELELMFKLTSKCKAVTHFIRESQYENNQFGDEFCSKLIICNHTEEISK